MEDGRARSGSRACATGSAPPSRRSRTRAFGPAAPGNTGAGNTGAGNTVRAEARGPDLAPSRFVRSPWTRPEGGGGVISVMHGRVFEKVGVNVSTVWGEFSPEFRGLHPGRRRGPALLGQRASRLVAHPCKTRACPPRTSTRGCWSRPKGWFGGGGDLTPMRLDAPEAIEDAVAFHAAFPRRLRPARPGLLPEVQGVVRPLLLPAAPQRAARCRRHILRPPFHRRRRRPTLLVRPRRR